MEQSDRGLVISRLIPLLLAVLWIPYLSLLSSGNETVPTPASDVVTTPSTAETMPSAAVEPQGFAETNEEVREEDSAEPEPTPPTTATSTSTTSEAGASGELATVVSVTDGDTIRIVIDGPEQPLRLIGIDAPEPGECIASEASARLSELVNGSEVELVRDQSDRDQFDRLLRYVYVDGQLVNEILVAEGLAIARRYDPDTAMAEILELAQVSAEEAQAGLWNPEACGLPAAGDLAIGTIHYDAAGDDNNNLNDEWVEIVNNGSAVDLTGWVLKDESASHRYTFALGFRLEAGASLRVYTGCGRDTSAELYWCSQGSAVWNNSGDTVFLLDPSGNISVHKSY